VQATARLRRPEENAVHRSLRLCRPFRGDICVREPTTGVSATIGDLTLSCSSRQLLYVILALPSLPKMPRR
jgi:hypothetical protein